ncbi:hypothetical protein AALP_AA1G056500 [Arabis alpina]|uniref:TF-B3 domain-containing protein n=1 Tax=Arabis alpina TaxID=50452 RepID=A0A087HLC7_ARAAL|nr:hypothetical protein AALP_AA1G056500 [Arabis alpina]
MATYGDDLAKTMWSDLCNLADVSAKVYDEEQLPKFKKSKPSSEEDQDQRVSHLCHRKHRTSLKKPVTRERTLPPWSSSVDFFRDYKIAVDSKSPLNPSGTDKSKKAKLEPSFSWIGKETPNSLLEMMANLNGEAYDPRLIFERGLTKTDVEPGQSRLSMPFNLLIRNDYLTPVELSILEADINNGKKTGVGAILVDQMSEKYGVMLKRWEQKNGWKYTLTCGWNDVVEANGFEEEDYISIWSFRWRGVLSFALVSAPSPDNGTE